MAGLVQVWAVASGERVQAFETGDVEVRVLECGIRNWNETGEPVMYGNWNETGEPVMYGNWNETWNLGIWELE